MALADTYSLRLVYDATFPAETEWAARRIATAVQTSQLHAAGKAVVDVRLHASDYKLQRTVDESVIERPPVVRYDPPVVKKLVVYETSAVRAVAAHLAFVIYVALAIGLVTEDGPRTPRFLIAGVAVLGALLNGITIARRPWSR